MTEEKPKTLASKLARIGKEIGAVSKSGTNTEQKYKYIEYGVVAGRIRELFDQYGVIIVPKVEDYKADEITSKYGSKGYHYVLNMSFKLINGDEKDDYIETTWLGESADYGDKGVNKAETSGTKYFLMRLFNVSEKDESEADSYNPEIASTSAIFPEEKLRAAKELLGDAESLEDLKLRFAQLGVVRKSPEIIKYKDELKAAFIGNDTKAMVQDAKDQLNEYMKGNK